MDDIAKRDQKLLVRELLRAERITRAVIALAGSYFLLRILLFKGFSGNLWLLPWLISIAAFLGYVYTLWTSANHDAKKARFRAKRFEGAWLECQDRLDRFDEVLKKMNKEQIGELTIMPQTVHEVAENLYRALRRADVIADEIDRTEAGIVHSPPIMSQTSDPQACELYRIADSNVLEYRRQYLAVMGGVQRTEAQCAVFITTLDNLRLKMLGYRLVGKSPEIPSYDFLEALAEARLQLDAIDKALDELDLGLLPKNIAVVQDDEPQDIYVGPSQT